MHRHGYKGRKLGRDKGPRTALIKGLASNLAEHESIETTLPKAKELVPYFERLITKAKKGDLHNRRQVISKMANVQSAHKLVDEIAPKLTKRSSGHLKITKTSRRRGDNSQMAKVAFVDDLKIAKLEPKKVDKPAVAKKTVTKKVSTKKSSVKTETKK